MWNLKPLTWQIQLRCPNISCHQMTGDKRCSENTYLQGKRTAQV